LAINDPEHLESRRLAAQAITTQTTFFEHLGTFAALQALAGRGANDPMDVVEDAAQRALLAEVLLAETKPPEETEVEGAIQQIQERSLEARLRDVRANIAEAERRGDFTELIRLTQQKLDLDRELQKLHKRRPPQG